MDSDRKSANDQADAPSAYDATGRPLVPCMLTFDDLVSRRPIPRRTIDDIVPIELVREGDVQVRVGTSRDRGEHEPVDLGPLAEFPSVRSVYAARIVRLRRPLPHVEELLATVTPPDTETLQHLPNLKRLNSGRLHNAANRYLGTAALPDDLEKLSVARHSLAHGWAKKIPPGEPPRFAELARFTKLTHLGLHDCWPGDSVAPLAGLTKLEWLWCDAAGGWSKLGNLTRLEEVHAPRPRVADLRAFRGWTRLRHLSLGGAGVKSLRGIDAFQELERLSLFLLKVSDLAPLAGLARLREISLLGVNNAHDLAALGTLPALQRLSISQAGIAYKDIVHVSSLAPLANARALEELTLHYTIVDDRDATPLIALPRLRRVALYGDLGRTVEALRSARPDVAVSWSAPQQEPGEKLGAVYVCPPLDGTTDWWLSEDLTGLLSTRTNADAERRLITALRSTDSALLSRLEFDTEASAVNVTARTKADIVALAHVITRLAKRVE